MSQKLRAPLHLETMSDPHHFLADGHQRAWEAHEPKVRAEVEAEFADRWKEASSRARRHLREEIEREIDRRLEELAPPNALY